MTVMYVVLWIIVIASIFFIVKSRLDFNKKRRDEITERMESIESKIDQLQSDKNR